jgi:hypothetical protein
MDDVNRKGEMARERHTNTERHTVVSAPKHSCKTDTQFLRRETHSCKRPTFRCDVRW